MGNSSSNDSKKKRKKKKKQRDDSSDSESSSTTRDSQKSISKDENLVDSNWVASDSKNIDQLSKVQRKRLSIMGKKVGNMDYDESEDARERNRIEVKEITDKDIENQGEFTRSKKISEFTRSKKTSEGHSRECQYVAISKKGYVPYDHDKKNQDSVICRESLKTGILDDRAVIHFFGVADGHGVVGHFVSQYVTRELPLECEKRFKQVKRVDDLTDNLIGDVLQESILAVADGLEESGIEIEHSGTTLCCSLIYDNMIYTANCGDSQGMIIQLSRNNRRSVVDLNELHKPDNPIERKRIEKYGGVVAKLPDLPFEDAGPFRVWNPEMTGPGLAMSRSLGDGAAHDLGVSSVPTIDARPLTPNCKYICWGSDGVFEFLTSDNVSQIMLKYDTIKEMAQNVVNEAVKWWRRMDDVVDDISCVLLKLPDPVLD